MLENIKENELKIADIFNSAGVIFKNHMRTIIALWLTVVSMGVAMIVGLVTLSVVISVATGSDIIGVSFAIIVGLLVLGIITTIIPMAITNITIKELEGGEIRLGNILPNLSTIFKGMITSLVVVLAALPAVIIAILAVFDAERGVWIGLAQITSLQITLILGFSILTFYLGIIFTFINNIIVHKGIWGISALFESARLVKGKFFKTLIFLILTSLFTMFPSWLQNITYQMPQGLGFIMGIIIWILGVVVSYYTILATSVWYMNRYYTKEVINE